MPIDNLGLITFYSEGTDGKDSHGFLLRFEPGKTPNHRHFQGGYGKKHPEQSHLFQGTLVEGGRNMLAYLPKALSPRSRVLAKDLWPNLLGVVTEDARIRLLHPAWSEVRTQPDSELGEAGSLVVFQVEVRAFRRTIQYHISAWEEFEVELTEHQELLRTFLLNGLRSTWDWDFARRLLAVTEEFNFMNQSRFLINRLTEWADQPLSKRQSQLEALLPLLDAYDCWEQPSVDHMLKQSHHGLTISLFLYDLGGGFSEARRTQLSLDQYWGQHIEQWSTDLPVEALPFLRLALTGLDTEVQEERMDQWLELWAYRNAPKATATDEERKAWGDCLDLVAPEALLPILDWVGDALDLSSAWDQWVNEALEEVPEPVLIEWARSFPLTGLPLMRKKLVASFDKKATPRFFPWLDLWLTHNVFKAEASDEEKAAWGKRVPDLPADLLPAMLNWIGDAVSLASLLDLWEQGKCETLPIDFLRKHAAQLSIEGRKQLWKQWSAFETMELYAKIDLPEKELQSEVENWLQTQLFQQAVVVCDLEIRDTSLKEWGIWAKGEFVQGTKVPVLQEHLQASSWLAGHNFLEFDLLQLQQRGGQYDQALIWDTYRIEMILAPSRPTYALKTKHEAVADVQHTLELLVHQTFRILVLPAELQAEVLQWLPTLAVDWLRTLTGHRLWKRWDSAPLRKSANAFFRSVNQSPLARQLLRQLGKANTAHFLLPESLWPLLGGDAELLPVRAEGKEIQVLDQTLIAEQLTNHWQGAALLLYVAQAEEQQEPAHWHGLSAALRLQLASLIVPDQIQRPISIDSLQALNKSVLFSPHTYLSWLRQQQESVAKPAFLLFPKLTQYWNRVLLQEIDRENLLWKDRLLPYLSQFSGGQDFLTLPELPVELNLEAGFCNQFWLEKTHHRSYRIWGSFELQAHLGDRAQHIDWEDMKLGKQLAPLELVCSTQQHSTRLRYNPETSYRDRYWAIQYHLLTQQVSSSLPVLWIIDQVKEVPKLVKMLRTAGWEVPDHSLSRGRQIELAQEMRASHRIVVIALEELFSVLPLLGQQAWQVWLDSLPLREWYGRNHNGQLSWQTGDKGTHSEGEVNGIPEEDAPDSGEEDETGETEPAELLEAGQPATFKTREALQGHLAWLRALQYWLHHLSSGHRLMLADSRLDDYPGLARSWQAHRQVYPLWKGDWKQVAYQRDLTNIRKFFPPLPEDRNLTAAEMDQAKQAILATFIGKVNGQTPTWRPHQLPFIDPILRQEQDVLVSLPTGGGKSLLFQGPALYRSSFTNRLSVVFTPLRALMEDQAISLWKKGFWSSVDYLNSDRGLEMNDILRRLVGGEICLIYITPERLRSRPFLRALEERLANDQRLEYGIFDEVHCLSQWGHDFRPDYLNSGSEVARMRKEFGHFPLAMFSATVSKRIQSQIVQALDPPNSPTIPDRTVGTKGITYLFRVVPKDGYLPALALELETQAFDPGISRALVFVRSRKKAEQFAEQLITYWEENGSGLSVSSSQIDFFHAGLSGEEREEKVEKYKKGELAILFATKAFGMGMDLPNIHYLFHLQPTGNLEDYLQEVGRAGRDRESLTAAGIENIRSICFLEDTDWGRARDLLKKGEMPWRVVEQSQHLIHEYYQRFRNTDSRNLPSEFPLPLPLNLLQHSSSDPRSHNLDTHFRISLYWLERLSRIKLGFYTPTHLVFRRKGISEQPVPHEQLESIRKILLGESKKGDQSQSHFFVLQQSLRQAAQVSNQRDLFSLVFEGHRLKYWQLDQRIQLFLTNLRKKELDWAVSEDRQPVMLQACLAFATKILQATPAEQEVDLEDSFLAEEANIVAERFFTAHYLGWKQPDAEKTKALIERYRKDFRDKRIKASFALMRLLPSVKHRSLYVPERVKPFQQLYHELSADDVQKHLMELGTYLHALLQYLKHTSAETGAATLDLPTLLLTNDPQTPGFYAAEQSSTGPNSQALHDGLTALVQLGYLRRFSGFFPRGIELYLKKMDSVGGGELKEEELGIQQEFEQVQEQRYLRLAVLQILSMLPEEAHSELVQQYFDCESNEEILLLIEHYVDAIRQGSYGNESQEKHSQDAADLLGELRSQALEEAEERLSPEQKKVYEAPLSQNQLVVAGPGSGKTHTLTLRIAQMIHRQQVQPREILVLAYNRAVAVEVKSRVRRLFRRLGYQHIINQLAVHTFDGFARKLIPEQSKAIQEAHAHNQNKFQLVLRKLLEIHAQTPGELASVLSPIRYVLIDEFQDVNELRMRILTQLFPSTTHRVLAIGDPNQSIYGYDREHISPRAMYEAFRASYQPEEFNISINFRSLPAILRHAEQRLATNQDTFEMEPLQAYWKPPQNYQTPYVKSWDFDEHKTKWPDQLLALLKEKNREGKPYRQVAIMCRTNEEVYLALKRVNSLDLNPKQYRVRVQGHQVGTFVQQREIAHLIEQLLRPNWQEPLPGDFFLQTEQIVAATLQQFPNWEQYALQQFLALVREFDQSKDGRPTGEELFQFIEALTRREDGQLSQIYHRHKAFLGDSGVETEVVLTTIHKVKGLEYDAVILPPSFADLPYLAKSLSEAELADLMEEERRLRYVAMTRARDRLVVINWHREKALAIGQRYTPPGGLTKKLGRPIKGDLKNTFLSFVARMPDSVMHHRLEQKLQLGQELELQLKDGHWYMFVEGQIVGRTSGGFFSPFPSGVTKIKGLLVSQVFRQTFEDAREAGFENHWRPWARKLGYTYYVSFAGYAQPG